MLEEYVLIVDKKLPNGEILRKNDKWSGRIINEVLVIEQFTRTITIPVEQHEIQKI